MKQIIPEVSHIPFRNSTLILTIFFQLIMFHTDSSKRLNTIFIIKSKLFICCKIFICINFIYIDKLFIVKPSLMFFYFEKHKFLPKYQI